MHVDTRCNWIIKAKPPDAVIELFLLALGLFEAPLTSFQNSPLYLQTLHTFQLWFVIMTGQPATICSKEVGGRGSYKKQTETEQAAIDQFALSIFIEF